MLLIYVCKFYGRAYAEATCSWLLQAHNHAEEGSLTSTVGTDDTHDTCGWKCELEVFVKHAVAKGLSHALCLDNEVAQTWTIGDVDFELLLALLRVGVHHLVVCRETCLRLSVTA